MSICLIALDFGTTTSKALKLEADLVRNAVTGRTEIRASKTLLRSEPVFTPFLDDQIDEVRLRELVESWLKDSAVGARSAGKYKNLAGGVIITGLAAKKVNARAIAKMVRDQIGDAVVAVADDPGKESWLAFMGSCAGLSARWPDRPLLNLDIGGGTTNLALGRDQRVLTTGSLWVGARHLRFEAGTYRLLGISDVGTQILRVLKIKKAIGEELGQEDVDKVVDFKVQALETAVLQTRARRFQFLEQLRFHYEPRELGQGLALTFSGGVGELVYQISRGKEFAQTPYGDLGVDLAKGIVNSQLLARDLREFVPANLGRATVSGLAFHGVEASGSTVFLRRPEMLPLRDLPLLGRINLRSRASEIDKVILSARRFTTGACVRAVLDDDSLESLRTLAGRVTKSLRKNRFPKGLPLIIFMARNHGKTFGQYVTDWGRLDCDVIVIDEIDSSVVDEKAYFASIAKTEGRGGVSEKRNLLVSFYGGLEDAEPT